MTIDSKNTCDDMDWTLIENDDVPAVLPKTGFAALTEKFTTSAKEQVKSLTNHAVEQQIKQIAAHASKEVAQKLHDILYLDPDRYGVDTKGRKVKIYTHQSRAVDALFRQVAGQDLNALFAQLPFPINHIAGTLRKKLEQRIIDGILERISSLAIEPTITNALMAAYGFTQSQISHALNTNQSKASNPGVNFEQKAQKPTHEESEALQQVQQELQQSGVTITLDDVIGYYENMIIDHVNDQIRATLVPAISSAARQVGLKSSDAMLTKVESTLYAGACLQPILPPGLGLLSPAAGLALNHFKGNLTEHLANKVQDFAQNAAQKNVPQQFINRVPEKPMATHLDEEFDAVVMDYTAPTLSNFLIERTSKASAVLGEGISNGMTWLYDNVVGNNEDSMAHYAQEVEQDQSCEKSSFFSRYFKWF